MRLKSFRRTYEYNMVELYIKYNDISFLAGRRDYKAAKQDLQSPNELKQYKMQLKLCSGELFIIIIRRNVIVL